MNSTDIKLGAKIAPGVQHLRRLSLAIAVGSAAFLASCSGDVMRTAEVSLAPNAVQTKAAVRHMATARPAVKLAKSASAKSRVYEVQLKTVTEVAAYGRGPYICSPSGFGRKSQCVARTTFN